jgi:hypothetical protein
MLIPIRSRKGVPLIAGRRGHATFSGCNLVQKCLCWAAKSIAIPFALPLPLLSIMLRWAWFDLHSFLLDGMIGCMVAYVRASRQLRQQLAAPALVRQSLIPSLRPVLLVGSRCLHSSLEKPSQTPRVRVHPPRSGEDGHQGQAVCRSSDVLQEGRVVLGAQQLKRITETVRNASRPLCPC